MQFSELNLSQSLQKSVQAMGFEETTPIQAQAIPPALEGRDIIGCAQTPYCTGGQPCPVMISYVKSAKRSSPFS